MKIVLATDEETKTIMKVTDFTPIKTKGEISHFIAELELIKLDLLTLWDSEEVQALEE